MRVEIEAKTQRTERLIPISVMFDKPCGCSMNGANDLFDPLWQLKSFHSLLEHIMLNAERVESAVSVASSSVNYQTVKRLSF